MFDAVAAALHHVFVFRGKRVGINLNNKIATL